MGWQVDSRGTLLRKHIMGCGQPGSPPSLTSSELL